MSLYDRCFEIVVGSEGGFSSVHADPGNWTGGKVGSGECRGTKFGISACAYPNKDIANLTLEQAKAIYYTDYWYKIRGDQLPAVVALIAFDAAVNNGVGRATRWLQAAVHVKTDGIIGGITLAAMTKTNPTALATELHAQRINFMARLATWQSFGLGWSRRLAKLPFEAAALAAADAKVNVPAVIVPAQPSPPSLPPPSPPPVLVTEVEEEESEADKLNAQELERIRREELDDG